ncbi:MAG: flagellar biosynthetic protein FliO [Anaerolineae bacterium]|nr:flagellar biosynthetic protein FliO [Anaerolineae bacterium]MDW8099694.1 flagellar biosynthetic protein FliO [Anaerolineae bacterium]
MGRVFRITRWLRVVLLIVGWWVVLTGISHAQDPVLGGSQLSAGLESTGFVRDYEELVPAISANPEPAGWRTALGVIGSLLLVVIAIYGTLWGIRAFLWRRGLTAARANWIQVWETVHLSPHRTLHLVEINGRLLVLGATDHQVSLLAEMDRETVGKPSPFAAQLASIADEPMTSMPQVKMDAAFNRLREVIDRLRELGRTEGI